MQGGDFSVEYGGTFTNHADTATYMFITGLNIIGVWYFSRVWLIRSPLFHSGLKKVNDSCCVGVSGFSNKKINLRKFHF